MTIKEFSVTRKISGPESTHFYSPSCYDDFLAGNDECEGAYWCTYCNQQYEICIRTGGILNFTQQVVDSPIGDKIRQQESKV